MSIPVHPLLTPAGDVSCVLDYKLSLPPIVSPSKSLIVILPPRGWARLAASSQAISHWRAFSVQVQSQRSGWPPWAGMQPLDPGNSIISSRDSGITFLCTVNCQ